MIVFVGSKVDWFQAAVNHSQLPTGGVFGIFNNQPVLLHFSNVFSFGVFFFSLLSNVTNKLHIFPINCAVVFLESTNWTSDGVNAICNGHG